MKFLLQIVFVLTLLYSPETKGKELVPQLTLVEPPTVKEAHA